MLAPARLTWDAELRPDGRDNPISPQVERIIVTHGKPEHPHNSDEFFAHTGLQEYPKYMVGGGYVISDDVARRVTQ